MRPFLLVSTTLILTGTLLMAAPALARCTAARTASADASPAGPILDDLRGQTVVDAGGAAVGWVADMLVDPATGAVTHLIVGLNGLDRIVAVPLGQAQILPGGTQIRTHSWSRAQIEALRPYTVADATGLTSET